MFIRYKAGEKDSVPVAKIYSQKEHNVRNSQIDKDALWAIRKLQASGHEAYIVGGALRDILLGLKPKDFDIATSASPRQVQKLFWNARIIGRRFKIVHLYFNYDKIIEVTTFRSKEENFEEGNNNIYGTIEEDAKRRDFSINSFYYNPKNGQLLDFNNAMEDFKAQRIRSLIPLTYSFSEDPVRMVRAVKYHVTTGFDFDRPVRKAIKKNASHLAECSTSRLTEEVSKILSSGRSKDIMLEMKKFKLLVHMLPCFSLYINYDKVRDSLDELDASVREAKESGIAIDKANLIYQLIKPLVTLENGDLMSPEERMHEVFRQAKVFISPMTPPNFEVERASQLILEDMGYKAVKAKKRSAVSQLPRKKPGDRLGRKSAAPEALSKKPSQHNSKRGNKKPQQRPVEKRHVQETLATTHDK